MRVVITRARKDGSFSDAGNIYRTVITASDENAAHRQAALFSQGDPYRLEFYSSSNLVGDPIKTLYRYGRYI